MFLRARDFNVENSTILLRKAIEWRQKAKPQNIALASVRETMDRGTIFMYGVDKSNRFVTTDKKKKHSILFKSVGGCVLFAY